MKQFQRIIIAVVFLVALVLAVNPFNVKAANTVQASIADGKWNTGTEVEVDLDTNPAPFNWYQLLARGVKISAPGKICHEFRGGQYKWIADIRQLVKGVWVKVPTTQGWQPSEEGLYMACAQAPAAGTYALFGYYTGPKEYSTEEPSACKYDTSTWYAESRSNEGDPDIRVYLSTDVPVGLPASFVVVPPVDSNYISPLSETTTTVFGKYDDVPNAYFGNAVNDNGEWTIIIRFTVGGCTKDLTVESPVD